MIRTLTEQLKVRNGRRHEEYQYLSLINNILNEGEIVCGRNGNTIADFGAAMHFSLSDGVIPLLTTKKVAWKTCLKELLWFISGSTDNNTLKNNGVNIWNGNGSREFLDSRGLQHLVENDLGPVYGHQWRFFNAEYTDCNANYEGKGVDQLEYVINQLKNPETRSSRRILMSAWNPCQLDEMALPPCHVLCQFNVIGKKLSCSLYQRSGDIGLGVPFNIASYCFLTHLLAHHCGLEAHEFVYYLGNVHIYDDHVDVLREQITREPFDFPNVVINCDVKSKIEDYTEKDFNIVDYKHQKRVVMEMRK
jgi:thymidylate synthase